jgi:phosphatidylglycerol---prolipoprotein diacylglyceryl transferase
LLLFLVMINWFHNFYPSPIAFSIAGINIHWYGLIICLIIILDFFILRQWWKRIKQPADDLYDLIFYVVLWGIIGARFFYVLFELPYYLRTPLDMIKIWQGGLAIQGAILSGGLYLIYFSRKKKINFWLMLDLIVPLLILGQSLGRWGNYFNQELFGYPTNMAWGIPIAFANRGSEWINYSFFHPVFFYEFIWDLCLALILIFILKNKLKKPESVGWGGIGFLGIAFHGLGRFIFEFWRIDDVPLVAGIRITQILALVEVAVALAGIVYKRYCGKSKKDL